MNSGHHMESNTLRQGSVCPDACDTSTRAMPCQRSIGMHAVSPRHNPQRLGRNQRTGNARRSNTKYILQTYSLKYVTTYNNQRQWKNVLVTFELTCNRVIHPASCLVVPFDASFKLSYICTSAAAHKRKSHSASSHAMHPRIPRARMWRSC